MAAEETRSHQVVIKLRRLSTWYPVTYTGMSPLLNCDAERMARGVVIKDKGATKRYADNKSKLYWL